jgi:DNA-binding beta-propeller fold protein YncE
MTKGARLLALTAAIGIAAAGCATTGHGVPTAATSTSITQPPHPRAYAPQVVLPFGELINHPAGVTVDAADNVYVLDLHYGQVWEMAAGTNNPKRLPYTGLGRAVDAAADTAGNLYVTDDAKNRVLKLTPGTVSPIVLPFTDLNVIAGVAVDPTGNVYVSDGLHFRILKLPVQ